MEERGRMSKRFVKTLFSGTMAAAVLFHALGSSSFVTLAENDEADDTSKTIQEENTTENGNDDGFSNGGDSNESTSDETNDSLQDSDDFADADNNENDQNGESAVSDGEGTNTSDKEESENADSDADDLEDATNPDAEADSDGKEDQDAENEKGETDDVAGFKLSYIANSGGKLSSDLDTTDFVKEVVDLEAEEITIIGTTAVADEGYTFANWTYDEQIISEEAEFIPDVTLLKTIAEDSNEAIFYANFTLVSEEGLTYNEAFEREVTVDGITITAHADAGIIPDGSVLNVAKADQNVEEEVNELAKNVTEDIDNEKEEKNSNSIPIKSDDKTDDNTVLNGTYTFDITITNDKVEGEIQPVGGTVTITFSNVIEKESAGEDTYLTAYYVETSALKHTDENKVDSVKSENTESNEDAVISENESSNENTESSESLEPNESTTTDSSEKEVLGLTKVSDPKNNTTDISFDAQHFSTYTIVSTRPTNSNYKPAEYTPKAYKILTGSGRELASGDFTFTIVRTDEYGNPYGESDPLYFKESGVPNDANGLVTFPTLSFDTPDTYYFKITEDIPADKDPHITYDENFYILRIYVSEYIDDRELLVANPAYVKNDTLPPVIVNLYDYYAPTINNNHAFKFSNGTNYYEGSTKKKASGYNKYTGDDSSKDKRVTGIIKPELVNGYPVLNENVTGSSESLEYLFTDASEGVVDKRENVILYKIGDAESYEYVNPAFYPFDGNGQKETGDSHNYHFSVVTEAAFVIPETGLVYTEDNPNSTTDMIYEFEGDDDVWVFIDGKLVIDLGGVHDKVGATLNFRTGEIQYYEFSNKNSGSKVNITTSNLSEVYGSTWKDGKVHTLKIFYFERGKSLSEFDSNFNLALIAEFNNVYEEEFEGETSVKFSGTKTLTGRTLAAGEFSFELKDEDGKVLETVTNSASGAFAFSEIRYLLGEDHSDVGDHKYTISEVIGSLTGVTYDTRVYNVTVTVSYDMSTRQLIATISGLNADGSGANFTNTYSSVTPPPPPPTPPTPPATPPSTPTYTTTTTPVTETPQVLGVTREVVTPQEEPAVLGERRRATGDESTILIRIIIIIGCAAILSGILIAEKKKEKNTK
jgi:pilin isopeptide linkage protein/fibro-slime domain-containing protein